MEKENRFLKKAAAYRPRKSALEAVGTARKRCFQMKWVVEFDIVGLFDNINHGILIIKQCIETYAENGHTGDLSSAEYLSA
ncbi:hypothetical protein SAMN05660299_02563 [Megasphaera paucivorans]|uniref:Reverse transcriptase (RNA-dependent DNA polymerase) n=2 Tax=Megasphaera paucivorans TaxID=349095 RepID=A0A1H0ANB1_9FIRM|nr:hypothetical protein SAMN05660299_02563 [Megasphaera paucivorans]